MRLHTPRQCRFANAAPSVSLFILFILFILCILFILSACMHGRRATPRPDPPRLLQRRLLRLMLLLLLLLFLCKHVLKLLDLFNNIRARLRFWRHWCLVFRVCIEMTIHVYMCACVHRHECVDHLRPCRGIAAIYGRRCGIAAIYSTRSGIASISGIAAI